MVTDAMRAAAYKLEMIFNSHDFDDSDGADPVCDKCGKTLDEIDLQDNPAICYGPQ